MQYSFFSKTFSESSLVFLDVETTGLSPEAGDTLCELAAIKVENNSEVDTFSTLLNPKQPIPPSATEIHGITNDDIAGAPYFEDIVDKFIYFLGNATVCAYNVGFDLGFINNELSAIKYPRLKLPALDILVMARTTVKNLERYNLGAIAKHFNIATEGFHRAFNDARTAKEVFFKLQGLVEARGITRMEDFMMLFGYGSEAVEKRQEKTLQLIAKRIKEQLPIRIQYFSSSNNLRTFIVMPQEVSSNKHATYLYSVNPKTQDALTFNISRILAADPI